MIPVGVGDMPMGYPEPSSHNRAFAGGCTDPGAPGGSHALGKMTEMDVRPIEIREGAPSDDDMDAIAEGLSSSNLGLGTALMSSIEAAARSRGCAGAWLDTFSFQARPFYERLGYRQFGELADFPPGHSRHFLHKTW